MGTGGARDRCAAGIAVVRMDYTASDMAHSAMPGFRRIMPTCVGVSPTQRWMSGHHPVTSALRETDSL